MELGRGSVVNETNPMVHPAAYTRTVRFVFCAKSVNTLFEIYNYFVCEKIVGAVERFEFFAKRTTVAGCRAIWRVRHLYYYARYSRITQTNRIDHQNVG